MRTYRRYILGCKRKFGHARGVFAYQEIVREYLRCKRDVVAAARSTIQSPKVAPGEFVRIPGNLSTDELALYIEGFYLAVDPRIRKYVDK